MSSLSLLLLPRHNKWKTHLSHPDLSCPILSHSGLLVSNLSCPNISYPNLSLSHPNLPHPNLSHLCMQHTQPVSGQVMIHHCHIQMPHFHQPHPYMSHQNLSQPNILWFQTWKLIIHSLPNCSNQWLELFSAVQLKNVTTLMVHSFNQDTVYLTSDIIQIKILRNQCLEWTETWLEKVMN